MALLIADSFNRADGPLLLSLTDGAGTEDPQPWYENTGGYFAIASNVVERVAGPALGTVTVDPRTADCEVEVTVAALDPFGNAGITFRFVDRLNYWVFFIDGTTNAVYLQKYVNGVFTTVASDAVTKVPGAVLKVVLAGDQIDRYYQGVLLGTVNDSFAQNWTRHGLWYNVAGQSWRLENFSISGTPAPPPDYLLHFELGPDNVSTGGSNHKTMSTITMGPVSGGETALGTYLSPPEAGNDGTREWGAYDLDVTGVFDPNVPMVVFFDPADASTVGDTEHMRRVRITDGAGVTVAGPEYPQGSAYTLTEQDGVGTELEMGESPEGGPAVVWDTILNTMVNPGGTRCFWFFSGPGGWIIGDVQLGSLDPAGWQ